MKRLLISILLIAVLLTIFVSSGSVEAQEIPAGSQTSGTATSTVSGPSREELENLIRAKAEELERVNRELETTHGNLESVRQQKATLQRELRALQYQVSQLELNIRADEITTQKLNLEIDSLNYDIRDTNITIEDKREAIIHILRELQKLQQLSLLVVFLRNDSLADGFLESQSLGNLKNQLSIDIANLASLHNQLNDKLQTVSAKKTSVEIHHRNLAARKVIVKDQEEERKTILSQTKNKESVYEQQLTELKKQQEAISDEISKIEEQLRASFDVSVLPVPRPGVFDWPIELKKYGGTGIVTQHFGEVSRLYRGRPHNGLDIGAPVGTPVKAADDGTVMAVDNNDRSSWNKYQYGKYIVVRHPNNLATLYAHLSRQTVEKGQTVKRGDIIGYSGSTGFATGPHLHFGAYWAPSVQFKSVPPAAGLVPVGVLVTPEDYLLP